MKRFLSFTIIELVIGLLISAIIISLAFYTYLFFNHQLNVYNDKSSAIKRFNLLNSVLQKDFDKADRIMDSSENTIIICKYGVSRVQYSINSTGMIREAGGIRDSFLLPIRLQVIEHLDDTTGLITRIRLSIQVEKERIPLFVQKIYSSQEIMSAEKLNYD
jgi:type II secretory pathway pseudopilin PulG